MPNTITHTARRAATTKIIEFEHPVSKARQDGVLVAGTANDFRAVLTNVPAGTYQPGSLRFFLKGSNPEIVGANTNVVTVLGPATALIPGAPVIGVATAGDGTVHATWQAPASDGGSPIIAYKLYRNGMLLTTLAIVYAYDDTTAVNGTAYTYQVAAVNAIGEGPKSAASTSVTPAAKVYDTILNAGNREQFDVVFAPATGGTQTFEFDKMLSLSGSPVELTIIDSTNNSVHYVTFASEYGPTNGQPGKPFRFTRSNGSPYAGIFPGAATTLTV